jgi:hypothetical protein
MKRIKPLGLMLVLSICLTGNIFATGPVVTGTVGIVPGLLSYVVEQVLSVFESEDCPLRICQNCRPNNEAVDGGNGDCRPKDN